MNSTWQAYLIKAGGIVENQVVTSFGDIDAELALAKNKTILSDLSHTGVISVSGDDAATFLQGQFTNDIGKVSETKAQYSGYCSPKGRLLASFLICRDTASYLLQLPNELVAPIQKRLTMFVLRAKVALQDKSNDFVRMGLAGDDAESLARKFFSEIPPDILGVRRAGVGSLIRLGIRRFELLVPIENAPLVWQELSINAHPVGMPAWEWLTIQDGIPTISLATQDQFVPQMINFELLGGVDFKKGCYTGQEIVARTQYLGKLKRRLYLAHLDVGALPIPGDSLYSEDLGDQASGMIVNAQPAPGGGYDLLACAQISSVANHAMHWKSITGPKLEFRDLPGAN